MSPTAASDVVMHDPASDDDASEDEDFHPELARKAAASANLAAASAAAAPPPILTQGIGPEPGPFFSSLKLLSGQPPAPRLVLRAGAGSV